MNVIYLIQSDTPDIRYDIPKSSDVMVLQWQHEYVVAEHLNSFHYPNSSWAEGRNELYKRCDKKYDYYVFLDDDLEMNFTLDQFEQMLEVYKPKRASVFVKKWPFYKWIKDEEHSLFNVLYIDHCLMAVDHEAAQSMLPYTTEFDKVNWWLSSEKFCRDFFNKYGNNTLLFKNICLANKKHRDYPRDENSTKIVQQIQSYTDAAKNSGGDF